MKERFPSSDSIAEMRREARGRITGIIEKFRDEPNLIINIEEETPDTITLGLRVVDPDKKEFKTYRKGFMKVLNLPNGSSIEEEVERQLRFPEADISEAVEKIHK